MGSGGFAYSSPDFGPTLGVGSRLHVHSAMKPTLGACSARAWLQHISLTANDFTGHLGAGASSAWASDRPSYMALTTWMCGANPRRAQSHTREAATPPVAPDQPDPRARGARRLLPSTRASAGALTIVSPGRSTEDAESEEALKRRATPAAARRSRSSPRGGWGRPRCRAETKAQS